MFKIFGKKQTSKFDVVMAIGGAIVAVWSAIDTVKDFKSETENQEIEK